ncbi:hypothetical protein R69658_07284 [Paraburkholderia aspalathi]|uniref:DUF1223 domain-containing protein n=1 Tax=Paraburkholderia aspalathi TaxID=1324617 RepID=A0ABN7NBR7_9BURK|nr:DUF1223 domain-containing protein [Paraburkholderia aspalathi]MBK3823619.1 DUF1223 domain-containing protein [Paraburkholderia aspalathi]MBK3835457.1 DUF1223 domain-containing protein [Paraburkholderia aspalathi]MBK3865217.1 DUF1223 domain-containing protein [Paraburkholderia aspalathi]CAE6853631.1 hypothetical protein R69658_07284 [Paraburkholderia aspalathi]CAE6855781.1 hypothetical protein R20943_07811 [Paraburkholderia aspalathi]
MQTARTRRDNRYVTRAIALAVALTTLFASGLASAAGAVCASHSPSHRVALVELYSSEGCNSCPPADNWLSQWKNSGASQSIVPLALHVDYWNSLGWTDRFSQHRFTERQQTLTDLAGGHTIYTPEIFVSGRELRSWSQRDSFQSRIGQVVAEPAQANVALELKPQTKGAFNVDAQFTSKSTGTTAPLNAYVAVYQNALNSQVRAGENSGATLHHERVVRQWIGPVPLVAGNAQIRRDIRIDDADANAPADHFGVVAFVENAATGDVLQVGELATCN